MKDDFGGRDGGAVFEKLRAAFAAAAESPPFADARDNARALLEGFLREMNAVTREEFDAQSRMLAAAIEKLEAIEARLESQAQAQAAAESPPPKPPQSESDS